jgi:hypothetical protein
VQLELIAFCLRLGHQSAQAKRGNIMRRWIIATAIALVSASPAWANIGRIKSASGGAFVERAGKVMGIKPGFVILPGDALVTPAKGKIGVTFVDNCRIAAGPNSRIVIKAFDYNDTTQTGRFVTEIAKGTFAIVGGLIAKSGPSAMQVRTPKALFAVRGARIVVRVR